MRAYIPRYATRELIRRIRALDGVARVDLVAPSTYEARRHPARLKVTLVDSGRAVPPASTTFSLAEARKWLESEEAK